MGCSALQCTQQHVQLVVQPGTLANDNHELGGDAREMSEAVQLSSKQKSALVCKFVPG